MATFQEKYPIEISINHRLWHDSQGNKRPYREWTPHPPTLPIDAREQALIEQVQTGLASQPTYAELEQAAHTQDTVVKALHDDFSLPDGHIVFLENDTTPIRKPQDKPATNSPIYYRENWRMRIGTPDDLIRRLEMGFSLSMGICDRFGDTIRQGVLWYAAHGIPLDCDEFNDGSPQKASRPDPCYSMDEFLNQHPQIKDVARYIIPSSRSLFENRPFKARAWVPFEIPVFDYRVFQRIAEKLNEMLPFLPEGVTKNGVAVASGAAHNADKARHFDGYIDRKFIQMCEREVIEETKQRKSAKDQQLQREQARTARQQEQHKRKAKLKAKGYDLTDTISPIEAFIAAVNPIAFMQEHGWITHLGGNTYHWHESGNGKSCEIDTDTGHEVVIKPFSNAMQAASPNAEKPVGGHRFILFNLYGLDVNNESDKKQLRKRLAADGYGTHPNDYKKIKAAEQQALRAEGLDEQPKIDADKEFVQSILDGTLDIPEVEVRETPAYKYWTPEQRILCEKIIGRDPDEGWYQNPTGIWTPALTTAYRHLHQMTHLDGFKMNGQPPEIEKRRIFFTQPGVCPKCNDTAAISIDTYGLTGHAYCPRCHKDTQIGSYLNYELKRKVENTVVSKHQGFLGNNPDFQHFELFRPGQLTYLGAAMATGKTTEIVKEIVRRVVAENKRGIICVPRISLARAIAHVFRKQHGYNAWGLWHEGSGGQNQFIGSYGAIVCLPSLSRVVTEAETQGLETDDLLIAIDELDFSYQLLSLATATKLTTKQILQQAIDINGLVVAGQTESTLALEAFAAELGLQPADIHGFYNTAALAEDSVEIRRYPDTDNKTDFARAEAVERIRPILESGKNAYVFCNERRDVVMLAELFAAENPVLYTAYHKGEARADAVLYNQKVTDTKLFLATSSAGIGINIHDPHAETVILAGALYGQRDIAMITQKTVRNRARTKVTLYLPPITTSLPIAPTAAENVSLYEQGMKMLAKHKLKQLPENAIRRLARSTALATLADNDPMTFFRHHLETVAGMKAVEKHVDLETLTDTDVNSVKEVRAKTRTEERDAVTQRIVEILNAPTLHVMTSAHIRAAGTAGKLTPMPIEQLAQERINAAAQALGYNDTETENFDFIDKSLLRELCLTLSDYRELTQQCKGWAYVHHNEWVHQQFEQHLKQNQHEDGLTAEQGALEITDIEDIRTAGALLTQLLDTLKGNTYTETTLAQTVKDILKKRHGNDTFMTLMQNGALGIKGHRATRFLHVASDENFVEWARDFIAQWYPVRIAKSKGTYYLTPQSNAELKSRVFQKWFIAKNGNDDFDGQPPPFMGGFYEPPNPKCKEETLAKQLVTDGEKVKVAAEKTGLPVWRVYKITKEIRAAAKAKQIETAQKLLNEENATSDIGEQLGIHRTTAKRLCDAVHVQSSIRAKFCNNSKLRVRTETRPKNARDATFKNQILQLLEKREYLKTHQIVEALAGHPVSVKKVLKELTETQQIIKVKHGVYALPPVTHEIAVPVLDPLTEQAGVSVHLELPQVLCDVQAPEVSDDTERDSWYAIYQIHNALTDRRMRTGEQIAQKTGLPIQVCNQTLDFMYQNVLVNAGVGGTYWMDTAARQRCFDYVLSVASLPNLVLYTYFLTQAVFYQRHAAYWHDGKGKDNLIASSHRLSKSEWEQQVYTIGISVAVLEASAQKLQDSAAHVSRYIFDKNRKAAVFDTA